MTMSVCRLIHTFYTTFPTKGELISIDEDELTVRVGDETYRLHTSLDCWKQDPGGGRRYGPEERKISAQLLRSCANALDGGHE